jgi:hypothetical protein
VQAIAVSSIPGTIYIGSANGGVWGTTNNGASWAPLTDDQNSLSIGALTVDPTDAEHVIAAIGRTSSASYLGGPLVGLLTTENGGQSWTTLTPSGLLDGSSANFTSLTYNDGVIIAGSSGNYTGLENVQNGIYRVDANGDGAWVGAGITPEEAESDPTKPLALGLPVTSIVSDPTNGNTIYAAVSGSQYPTLNGLYLSTNNGQSFTRILDSTTPAVGGLVAKSSNMRVATSADGTTYVVTAVNSNQQGGSTVDALLVLNPTTGDWTRLTLAQPLTFAEQSNLHLALSVSPNNSNIVYVGTSPPSY